MTLSQPKMSLHFTGGGGVFGICCWRILLHCCPRLQFLCAVVQSMRGASTLFDLASAVASVIFLRSRTRPELAHVRKSSKDFRAIAAQTDLVCSHRGTLRTKPACFFLNLQYRNKNHLGVYYSPIVILLIARHRKRESAASRSVAICFDEGLWPGKGWRRK